MQRRAEAWQRSSSLVHEQRASSIGCGWPQLLLSLAWLCRRASVGRACRVHAATRQCSLYMWHRRVSTPGCSALLAHLPADLSTRVGRGVDVDVRLQPVKSGGSWSRAEREVRGHTLRPSSPAPPARAAALHARRSASSAGKCLPAVLAPLTCSPLANMSLTWSMVEPASGPPMPAGGGAQACLGVSAAP